MYVLTSERIGLTGAFECPDQFITLETGLRNDQLEKAKAELETKIMFSNGWIAIKNAAKYNNYANSPIHKKAYDKELELLPENIRNFILIEDYYETSLRLDKNNKYKIKNKKEEIKEFNNIDDLTPEVLQEISNKEQVKLSDLEGIKEDIKLYCQSHGKSYKDYKAVLLTWLRKDLKDGKIKRIKIEPVRVEPVISEEQRRKNIEALDRQREQLLANKII